MIRILFGKSIFCLVVCLSILCANPAAHAQITVSANPMTVRWAAHHYINLPVRCIA